MARSSGNSELQTLRKNERRAEALGLTHGFIEAEHEGERTVDVKQEDIIDAVNLGAGAKKWRFLYKRGPYLVDYTDDGSFMVAAGRRGEARLLDCRDNKSARELCVVNTFEAVRAAKLCYNENCWALAQKHSVCLYDSAGTRTHDFEASEEVTALDFLPYHFLLATASAVFPRGVEWRDLSTGKYIARLKSACLSPSPEALKKNLYNGCIYTGHSNGIVNVWSPNLESEAMSFHAASGGATAVQPLHRTYVAVASARNVLRIYDIRNPTTSVTHCPLRQSGPVSMDASFSGLLAVSQGPLLNVWRNPTSAWPDAAGVAENVDRHLYMRHRYDGSGLRFENVRFRPFEDVLAAGLNEGVETLIIPGSGCVAVDVMNHNPYATTREKAKALVRRLLDKLPPDTITLDPTQFLSTKSSADAAKREAEKRRAKRNKETHVHKHKHKKQSRTTTP